MRKEKQEEKEEKGSELKKKEQEERARGTFLSIYLLNELEK